MEKELIDLWEKNKSHLEEFFNSVRFVDYETIVQHLIVDVFNHRKIIFSEDFTTIDNGDYQGTLVFILHKDYYQPTVYDYYITYVEYGSCSVCDTLQGIMEITDKEEKTRELMILALHLVQHIKLAYE